MFNFSDNESQGSKGNLNHNINPIFPDFGLNQNDVTSNSILANQNNA